MVLPIIIVGCTSSMQKEMADEKSMIHNEAQQGYTCTMNCEKGKIYDQPGNCPRCGMALEPVTNISKKEKEYKMDYESFPAELMPGSPGSLYFKPQSKDNNEAIPLEVVHEKKIHLIIVSEDLGYFDHVHPEEHQDGSYRIHILSKDQNFKDGPGNNETRFEQPGTYFLFADYKPKSASHQLEKIEVHIPGTGAKPIKYTSSLLSNRSGPYLATLKPFSDTIIAGKRVHLNVNLYRDNKPIDAANLENYLGSKAHIVAIGLNKKDYIHLHPEVVNGKFELTTVFDNPGIYRAWIQFSAEGKLHTIDFTIIVANKDKNNSAPNSQHDMHHHHNH